MTRMTRAEQELRLLIAESLRRAFRDMPGMTKGYLPAADAVIEAVRTSGKWSLEPTAVASSASLSDDFDLPVGNYFAEIVGGPPLKTFTVTAGGGKTHVRFV